MIHCFADLCIQNSKPAKSLLKTNTCLEDKASKGSHILQVFYFISPMATFTPVNYFF